MESGGRGVSGHKSYFYNLEGYIVKDNMSFFYLKQYDKYSERKGIAWR